MTKIDFDLLSKGDLVCCMETDQDMPFGWNDDMDEMVALNLKVESKIIDHALGYGVCLKSLDTGSVYTFNHTHLTIIKINTKDGKLFEKFSLNGFVYEQQANIYDIILSLKTLKEDRELFKKHVMQDKEVSFNKNTYYKIKKHCPRIIGVLLGNKIIIKYKEVK